MSKRFSILAAALVASGRSLSTTLIDRSGRLIRLQAEQDEDLSIEEIRRFAFIDLEEGRLGHGRANSVRPRVHSLVP
jgi:hypothetical protein